MHSVPYTQTDTQQDTNIKTSLPPASYNNPVMPSRTVNSDRQILGYYDGPTKDDDAIDADVDEDDNENVDDGNDVGNIRTN